MNSIWKLIGRIATFKALVPIQLLLISLHCKALWLNQPDPIPQIAFYSVGKISLFQKYPNRIFVIDALVIVFINLVLKAKV